MLLTPQRMRRKAIIRMLLSASVIFWIALVVTALWVVFVTKNKIETNTSGLLPAIVLNLYIISLYYYYKLKIDRDDRLNFIDLLWKVFATGLVATIISLALLLLQKLLGQTRLASDVIYLEFNYLINLGLLISFLLAAFTVWKRLILYQKSKSLLRIWTFFEYTLLATLIYNSVPSIHSTLFTQIVLGLLVINALVLSGNMKWVAYLNYRQKWTSLLLLILTIFYLGYGFYVNGSLIESISSKVPEFIDHREHIFLISVIAFVGIYNVFSFLVILFNLPTTSVFEQKLEEVVNYQRISQSIQTEQSEESVYNILMETSVSTVFADAAWLEITEDHHSQLYTYKMSEQEAVDVIEHLKQKHVTGVLEHSSDKTKNLTRYLSSLKGTRFRSIMTFPIMVKGETIGRLALLKELSEGFNSEMTKIVATFANQAGISIENFRLLEEALQSERYKEELKIAKNVQKSLLPGALVNNPDFQIAAFSESADEVGGDYYDALKVSDQEVALIIADVSGKGTTAAFHMSQLKGVFHSLAQECIEPREFMIKANRALVYCLERGSFISAAFFIIDMHSKTVRYARAGHCPVLRYDTRSNKAAFLEDRGVALGMVKSSSYANYIDSFQFNYEAGDVILLYTDGITEARNLHGDEFGGERLAATLLKAKEGSPKEIQECLIDELYRFSGTENINDDYTTVIIKFH